MRKTTARILVVSDRPDNSPTPADSVVRSRFDVVAVTSFDAALEVLVGESFAILLADITFGRNDALDLIRRAVGHDASLAVIAVGPRGSLQMRLDALHAGAADYLPVPFGPDELRDRLSKALEGRERNLALRMHEESERLRKELDDLLKRNRG